MPVEYLRGSICGHQVLTYDGGDAYSSITPGTSAPADSYAPILVTKVARLGRPSQLAFFQIRSRSSVNMSAANRHNLALMGGAGAIYSALVRNKAAQIYKDCASACPKGYTLRSFVFPLIHDGLKNKDATIVIASGVGIVNPWVSNAAQNVPIDPAIVAKFDDELKSV